MALTPGPWRYDGRRWIRDAAGIGVLRVQLGANPDDARCAAAAPALLRVLREIVSQIDQGGSNGAVFGRDNCIEEARVAIIAAQPKKVSA
jgi:hypothetical protein